MADIAPSSIVLRGCLKKKSPKGISGLRAWQKRHFFLFDDQLAYAKQDDVGKIQGTIPLSEVTCIEQIQGKPTRIRIEVATRRFDLDAATSDECDNWIAALQRSWISTKEKLAGAPVLSPHSSSSIANPRSPLMTGKFWKASTSGNMPSGGSSGNDNLSAPSITATVLNSKAFTPIKVPSLLTESGYFGTVSRRSATSPPSPIKSRGSHVSAETLFQDNDSNPPSHYDLQSHHSDYATTTTTSTTPKVSNLIRNAMKRSQSINNSLFSGNDSSKEPDGADIGFADFERGDKIADCGIGSLNRAILRDTNESYLLQVAMKRDEHYDKGVMLIKLMNRVELRHPFFSQLAFSGSTPDRAWAAYKFVAPSATLFERLRSVKRLPEDQACNYLSQVLLFTAFLHQSGRLFRNMKPEFIGLDAINDEIMVLDLEGVAFSSVRASETEELPDGDVFDEFWTPELIAGQGESLISDWWRLGSLLYELLVGFPPFRAKSREELLAKTRDGSVRFPPFISSAAQDFIRRCLIHDPNHRLGADIRDLFSHRLFQDVNWAGAHWKVISRSVPDVDPDPPVRVKVKVKDLSEFPGSGSSLEPIIRLTYGDQTWTSQPNTSYSSTPSWNSNCQFYHDTYAAAANSLLKVEVCAGQVPLAFAFEAVDLLVRGSQKKRVQLSNIDGTLLGVLTLEIKVKDTDVNQDQDTSPEHSLRMLKRSMTSSSSMKGGGKAGRPGLNVSRPHRRASLLQDMSDKLSGKLRSLVSKNKLRFQVDGFDLDLTYLTSQMIVMGFPSSNLEGVYRNPMEEVQRFVKTYHNGHCRVINLCSERSYDPACFDSNCASFPFDDHTPPPIKLIVDFCRDGKAYLDGHPDNVIAIHCKAGKGRSGVMASSFLLYLGLKPTAATALDFFGDQRTADGKGVTIPSQIRAVHTFEKYLRQTANDTKPFPFNSHYQNILLIRMSPEPDLSPLGGCDPFCRIYRNRSLIFDSLIGKVTVTRPAKDIVDIPVDCVVNGDIKIAVYHKTATGKKLMFSFWINIDFIENNHVVLDKAGLDKADKNNKFDPSFHVELFTKSAEHAKIESLEAANQGSDEEATEDDSQHSNATARPSRGATTSASIDTINSDKFPKMRKRSPHAISGSLPDLHEYPTNDEDDDLSKVSVTSSQSNSAEPFFNTPIDIDPSPMSDVIEEHDGNSAAESPSSSTIGFAAGKGVSRRQSRQQQTDLAEIDEGNNQDEDDDDNDDDDDADDDDDDHQAEPKTAVE